MIETIGTLCVLWTLWEMTGLAVRASRTESRRVRAWDSQGNELHIEEVK